MRGPPSLQRVSAEGILLSAWAALSMKSSSSWDPVVTVPFVSVGNPEGVVSCCPVKEDLGLRIRFRPDSSNFRGSKKGVSFPCTINGLFWESLSGPATDCTEAYRYLLLHA